jgi:hypothetical protein
MKPVMPINTEPQITAQYSIFSVKLYRGILAEVVLDRRNEIPRVAGAGQHRRLRAKHPHLVDYLADMEEEDHRENDGGGAMDDAGHLQAPHSADEPLGPAGEWVALRYPGENQQKERDRENPVLYPLDGGEAQVGATTCSHAGYLPPAAC